MNKKYKGLLRYALLALIVLSLLAGCQNAATETTEANAAEDNATEVATGKEGAVLGSVDAVNEFLNTSADLGEGSVANPVAVIPFSHIDGSGNEADFYAFVHFKYVARDYIKYQISYASCTCREASVNYWQTAYVELSLPESGKIEDAVIKTISYEKDPTGHYNVGVWADSSPVPNGTTYDQLKTEYISYFIGKTLGQINGWSTTKDIDPADYQSGEGRSSYSIDAYSGATVSTNNMLRMLLAIGKYHGTDPFFAGSGAQTAPAVTEGETAQTEVAKTETPKTETAPATTTQEVSALPAPRDTTKTFKENKDATEDTPCAENSFSSECSAINTSNLINYLGRDDVLYIDLRNFEDYVKKHFKNFEVVPFFAYIYNAEAHTNSDLTQLYGGTPTEPVPVYEESDTLLNVFFPKDKTIFVMCQSGGRVKMLMEILEARGWDMSKIYNIGGMAQYTGSEYRNLISDSTELTIQAQYGFEGLTRIAP